MKRLGIFAHFDAQNEVKRYIQHYLEALREHCSRLIFVSVSPLPEAEQAKLRALSCEVVIKDNVGFDFSMWKRAIYSVDLAEFDELLLANSSVFGPLRPLGPCFEKMKNDPCDVWGMTDNLEIGWHIQSYFLVFKPRVLHSPEFMRFWDSVLDFRDKRQVIRSYEVGLSVFLKEQGFNLKPLYRQAAIDHESNVDYLRMKRRKKNPTCAFPADLLRMGMPFVKVELLRDNPLKARLDPVWAELEKTGYDLSLIEFDRPLISRGWPYDLSAR